MTYTFYNNDSFLQAVKASIDTLESISILKTDLNLTIFLSLFQLPSYTPIQITLLIKNVWLLCTNNLLTVFIVFTFYDT